MPTVIDATYRVVTPLFCSGAKAGQPELRLTSFKGVLRFWWRALAWSQYSGRLETIREHENLLFGSPDSGQSRVIMRLMHAENSPATSLCGEVLRVSGSSQAVGQGARYLGYGLMEVFSSRKKRRQAGQLIRACLRSPFEFAVQMRGRNLSESEVTSLRNALIALGTLGGMGAKSRKGYGSMVLQSLHIDAAERWSKPKSPLEMRKVIASLRNNSGIKALPEFTALSPGSRHVLVSSEVREPVALLNLIGCELLRFRSWGRNGKILGRFDSERRFQGRPRPNETKGEADEASSPYRVWFAPQLRAVPESASKAKRQASGSPCQPAIYPYPRMRRLADRSPLVPSISVLACGQVQDLGRWNSSSSGSRRPPLPAHSRVSGSSPRTDGTKGAVLECLGGSSVTWRIDVSVGPVQGFVAQSRRTRDLWGSSYLLSFLSAHAMRSAEVAGGRIIRPSVNQDQLYHWVTGSHEGTAPRIGTVPNHFVVEVDGGDASEVAGAAETALKAAWNGVCTAVWDRFVQHASPAGRETHRIWIRQIFRFWEVTWTAGPPEAGSALLARRKHWRSHRLPDEPGDKCMMMHDLQELSGYVRSEGRESRKNSDRFWNLVRKGLGPLDLDDNERLCAIALVKRLFPRVSLEALGWKVDTSHWPSQCIWPQCRGSVV